MSGSFRTIQHPLAMIMRVNLSLALILIGAMILITVSHYAFWYLVGWLGMIS